MRIVADARDVNTERIMESARRVWEDRYREKMPHQWELVAAVRHDSWWVLEFEWLERRG